MSSTVVAVLTALGGGAALREGMVRVVARVTTHRRAMARIDAGRDAAQVADRQALTRELWERIEALEQEAARDRADHANEVHVLHARLTAALTQLAGAAARAEQFDNIVGMLTRRCMKAEYTATEISEKYAQVLREVESLREQLTAAGTPTPGAD